MSSKLPDFIPVAWLGAAGRTGPAFQPSSLFSNVSSLTLLLGVVVFALVSLYVRLFVLHPLARYPGPFLARCTNLYAGYYAWKGTLHLNMYQCHQKYGPYVRYGPNRLLIDTNDAASAINSHKANTIKSRAYQALVHSAPNTLTIRQKEHHARNRRILSLAFSDAKVLSYEGILLRHIKTLCNVLGANSTNGSKNDSFDMSSQSDYFTFDIMSEVIFGMKYNALKEVSHRYVAHAIQESNVRVGTLVQAYGLTMGGLDKYLFPSSIRARNKFLRFVGSLLRDRKNADVASNGNVFTFLETAQDPDGGQAFGKSEIRAECVTLIVAGSDTSSSALAAALFYLSASNNSAIYRRLCDEVRSKFQKSEDIKIGNELNSCVFLRASIEETMRMTPPVGGSLWREVGAGGITIDSSFIPQGVDVGTGIYSLHHNPAYHKEPFKFRPERWIVGEGGSTQESVALTRSAFMPFSSGPRGCIGKGFAYHELTLALAHILYRFDFHQTPDYAARNTRVDGHQQFILKDHITGAKEGPELCFTAR